MKKLIIILLFSSCWDGEVNGVKYRLKKNCAKGHQESYVTQMIAGKTSMPVVRTRFVCDCYGETDTIWQNKQLWQKEVERK